MSFSDYDYSDYDTNNPQKNITTPQNIAHHSNLPSVFQAKNYPPLQVSQKFDYAQIIQQTKDKKQQQLNDLRMTHARKNASLAARFNMPYRHKIY